MSGSVLTDKNSYPSTEVLKNALKDSYDTFAQWQTELDAHGIELEWRYYNDGKSWLGKLPWKKKNLGWLSIRNGEFCVTCHFMEKHRNSIIENPALPKHLKEEFFRNFTPEIRLTPMTIAIRTSSEIGEALAMLLFKQALK